MSASPPPDSFVAIDRQKTVPFLLNFCYRSSAFHSLTDFPIPTPSNPKPPLPAHVEIYTWMNCTLRELSQLLTTALPSIVPDPAIGTRLAFRLVYPDMSSGRGAGGRLDGEGRGRYISREVGSVIISAPGSHENGDSDGRDGFELGGEDAEKTLEDARFVIGDFVDVAVFPPLSDGSVVSRGSALGGFRGGRENGYSSRGGRGGFGGGRGRGFDPPMPAGEWRRGERLPESGYRGGRGRARY